MKRLNSNDSYLKEGAGGMTANGGYASHRLDSNALSSQLL